MLVENVGSKSRSIRGGEDHNKAGGRGFGLGSEVGSWIRIFLKKISARGKGDAYSNSELNPPRKRFAVSIFDVGEA